MGENIIENGGANWGMGGAWWVIFLFFILCWGGGGLGFGNGSQALTRAELGEGFNFQGVRSKLEAIQEQQYQGSYNQLQGVNNIQQSLCCGFNGVNQNINQSAAATAAGFAEVGRSLDALRYESSKNTADLIDARQANNQRIVDIMNNNTIQDLRDKLQAATFAYSQCQQNSALISELRPASRPAYLTTSPYSSLIPVSYNLQGLTGNTCGGCIS